MEPARALDGRLALVVGAGTGIGAATARALAAAGASLVLSARSQDDLDAVAETIRAAGGTAEVVPGDVTDEAFVDALFDRIEERHGRLDVLVNSAGMWTTGAVEEIPAATLRAVLEINTVAPWACMRRAIRLMRAGSDDGVIVNVGSTQAYWPMAGEIGLYSGSKFALRALTMGVARQLKEAGSGIRVSMVHPGATDTPLVGPESKAPDDWMLDPADVSRTVLHVVTAPPGVHVFDTVVFAQPFPAW